MIVATIIREAIAGKHRFVEILLDRVEGKPEPTAAIGSGEGGGPPVVFYIPDNQRDPSAEGPSKAGGDTTPE